MQQIVKDQTSATLRRMLFVAELSAARNETQRLDLNDFATDDSFTITYDGSTTTTLSHSADISAALDTALEALTNIDTVTVVKGTGQVYDVTFTGTHAATTLNLMTINVIAASFTPTGVTRTVTGGAINSPAIGETFTAAQFKLSKNGGALTNCAGTFTEIGEGAYYYNPTVGEVDTVGFLSASLVKSGLASAIFGYQITETTSSNGETIVATGTAQSATASTLRLASGASTTSNQYIPCRVDITAGTGANQGGRLGFSYNGTTKDLSIEPAWVTVPDATSTYRLTSIAPNLADVLRVNHQVAGTFGGDAATPGEIVDEFMARSNEFADDMFDLTDGVETSLTLRQAMRLLVAASAGKLSGGATTTVTIRNTADTKNRIVATVDSDGNRTAITTDLT